MSDFGNHFGINTYAYSQNMSAADCMRHLVQKGTRSFELMLYPGHLWIDDDAATLRDIREVISTNDLELTSLNAPNIDLNIAAATQEMREFSLNLNKIYLRIAGELGASGLIFGPGKSNPLFPLPAEVLEGHFFRALDILLPIAKSCGVELFVENMPFAYLPSANDVMSTLARYGNDDIKICYDVANGHFINEDPVEELRQVAPRLALVHASDTTRSVFKHDAVGDGDLDFSPLPEVIAEVGYSRPVMLEIISKHPDADIAKSVASLTQIGLGRL